MTSTRRLGVAAIGLDARGWHLLERLGLRDDVQIAGAWDASPQRRTMAREQNWAAFDTLEALLNSSAIDGVAVVTEVSNRQAAIEQCLAAGKHVLTEPPIATSTSEARMLYDLAAARGLCCWAASPRRWDDDVLAARVAIQAGRLGRLRALRLTSAEWAPWATITGTILPADQRSTLDLLLPHILDQLGEFTSADVGDVWVQPFPAEDGILAVLTLNDGTVVQLDLRRRTLTSLQTGWLLEGEAGGYRGGRIYTPTVEGEIVDEAVRCEPTPYDPWVSEWLSRCPAARRDNERQRGERLAECYARLKNAIEIRPALAAEAGE